MLEARTEKLIIINGTIVVTEVRINFGNDTGCRLICATYSCSAVTQLVNDPEIIPYTYFGWYSANISKFETMILNIFYLCASQITPSPEQQCPLMSFFPVKKKDLRISEHRFLAKLIGIQLKRRLLLLSKYFLTVE